MSFLDIVSRPLRSFLQYGQPIARVAAGVAIMLALTVSAVQAVTCQNGVPPSNPDAAYQEDAIRGVVTDLRTGLMWKRTEETTTMTWAQALAAAEASVFAGYSDWRLPNIKELRSLVEECRVNPSINNTLFPGASSSSVWSGSPYAGSSSFAWFVYFDVGYANYSYRSDTYAVRLVRGGQSFGNLVNGVCGTAAGVASATAPTANLCTSGTTTGAANANGAWAWTCNGANGGTNASCSAPLVPVCRRPTRPVAETSAFIRFLQGVTGTPLMQGLFPAAEISPAAAAALESHYRENLFAYDFNNDGQLDQLIDGVLFARYALGFRGAELVQGLAVGTVRTTAQIEGALAACQ